MKLKSFIAAFLSVVLLLACVTPVRAVDESESENEQVTASSLGELTAAIEAAADGDIIRITDRIIVSSACTIGAEDKRVVLMRHQSFPSQPLMQINLPENEAVSLRNLIVDNDVPTPEDAYILYLIEINGPGKIVLENLEVKNYNCAVRGCAFTFTACNAEINNCRFENGIGTHIAVRPDVNMLITNSSFIGGKSQTSAGSIVNEGHLVIDNCIFKRNISSYQYEYYFYGGAIKNSGYCEIKNSLITANEAGNGGGIASTGELVLSDSIVYGNTASARGNDIYIENKAHIAYSTDNLTDIYSIVGRTPLGWYIDALENRFDGESNITSSINIPLDKTDEARLSLRFVFDDEITEPEPEPEPKPEPTPEPEPDPDPEPTYTPRPHAPDPTPEVPEKTATITLSCNGAILDCSAPIALLGYDDGLLHEEDEITRAQAAQLIYRILTPESIEQFHTLNNDFSDVAPDEWHNEAISTIASAGIIEGYDNAYHPNDALTWGQLITLFARFVEPVTDNAEDSIAFREHWAYSYIVTASAYGWLDDVSGLEPDKPVTRRDAVDFINSILAKYA